MRDVKTAADTVDDDRPGPGVRMSGHVKWFDFAKGYGFVVPEIAEGVILTDDVMLHVSCLRTYGENSADEGAKIVCDIVQRDKGWQVLEILEMDRPRAALAKEQGAALTYEPVVVKWFNNVKGFGFVNRPGSDEDIFIHISVMRKIGLEMLETGMQLEIVTGKSDKGENVVMIKKSGVA